MDHAASVRVGDRLAHLLEGLQKPRPILSEVMTVADQFRQRHSLDELHGEERAPVREDADLVDGRNAGML